MLYGLLCDLLSNKFTKKSTQWNSGVILSVAIVSATMKIKRISVFPVERLWKVSLGSGDRSESV